MDTFLVNSESQQAITAAIKQFLRTQQMPTAVTIQLEKQEKGYARARVTRTGDEHNAAFALVKQETGGWRVLGFGTFFEGPFYEQHGVPRSVRL